jgi:hypothetical protein
MLRHAAIISSRTGAPRMKRWLIVSLWLVASSAFACKYDAECDIGSRCLKQSGATEGASVNAKQPGHARNDGLSRDPTDPANAQRQICDVDLDCGISGKCVRATGQTRGTCAGGGGILISH